MGQGLARWLARELAVLGAATARRLRQAGVRQASRQV